MDTLRIAVIIGSVRPNRFADKPADWITREAKKLADTEVEVLDLNDYPMPFFEELSGPSSLNKQYAHDVVKKFSAKIEAADAYIMVSPEYNHSTSGVLKNALDQLFPEWNRKVAGFVSYGSVGGARAVEHLRQICAELEMATTRTNVHIPGSIVWGGPWTEETEKGLEKNATKMLGELAWWGRALKIARAQQNA